MRLILLGIDDEDRKLIETHLFARQFGVIIKENFGYMYVDVATLDSLCFLSVVLKCDFLFTNNGFQANGKRYSTIKIIREGNKDGENTDCRNGVLPKEQVV